MILLGFSLFHDECSWNSGSIAQLTSTEKQNQLANNLALNQGKMFPLIFGWYPSQVMMKISLYKMRRFTQSSSESCVKILSMAPMFLKDLASLIDNTITWSKCSYERRKFMNVTGNSSAMGKQDNLQGHPTTVSSQMH